MKKRLDLIPDADGFRVCTKCGERKYHTNFASGRSAGKHVWCNSCRSIDNRSRTYGITIDEVNELLSRGCEACGSTTKLTIDHNHATGVVRGCLCDPCNRSLGFLKEDETRIRMLANYIERHKGLE